MSKENSNEGPLASQESCPKSYKPWVWTLVIMTTVTLGWTLYENYIDNGIIKTLLNDTKNNASYLGGKVKQESNKWFNSPPPAGQAVAYATPVAPAAPYARPVAPAAPYARPVAPATPYATPVAGQNVEDLMNRGSFHDVISMVRPAVISIYAASQSTNMEGGLPDVNYSKVGSGVIIDSRGFALSSLHVIQGASTLKASVYSGGGMIDYPLKVVNANQNSDLVLLRIQGAGPFSYSVLGDSGMTRTGDVVLAMGSPFGFDQTVTSGIISSRNRTLNIGGRLYEDVIQTDTSINKGNSGGPLVNLRGEVIGINTAIYSPSGSFSGIGFTIPINQAATLVSGVLDFGNTPAHVNSGQLVAWTNSGRQVGNAYKLRSKQVLHAPHEFRGRCIDCHPQLLNLTQQTPQGLPLQPIAGGLNNPAINAEPGKGGVPNMTPATNVETFLGILGMTVDPVLVKSFRLPRDKGVFVDRVVQDGPGELAGLLRGDIITRVDRKKIRTLDQLREMLASKKPAESVEIVLLREGQRQTVTVVAGERGIVNPTATIKGKLPAQKGFEWFGTHVTPLPSFLKPYINSGVYVENVEGILARSGLKAGDVIQRIDKRNVSNMPSFSGAISNLDLKTGFMLGITRSGRQQDLKVSAMTQRQIKKVTEFEWLLGAEVQPLPPTLSSYIEAGGVYVAEVEGTLALSGLRRGDIIQSINQETVVDINVFMDAVKEIKLKDGFLLEVLRDGKPMYITVKG